MPHLLRATLLASSVGLIALVSGCRGDDTGTGATSSSGANNAGGNGNEGGGASTGGGSEGGGSVQGCEGPEVTVADIATGSYGPGTKVAVTGVVAMSQKFLVSKSSTTDNCLWGVFVSAPGLTETEANSGLLILSYGTKATIPPGGDTAFCPKLGQDPAGDKIPDNTMPGDVLNVVGVISRFPDQPTCDPPNPPNQVGMLQLGSVCSAEKTGEAAVPAPHVLTSGEITSIQSTTDQAFHDQWGAVKVRVENVGVEAQGGMVVGDFGIIKLANGIEVGDKIYYRGYSDNVCHAGPQFTDTAMTFDYVDGFHYLAFCTWGLQANDKCADFSPSSGDCTAADCPPDLLP